MRTELLRSGESRLPENSLHVYSDSQLKELVRIIPDPERLVIDPSGIPQKYSQDHQQRSAGKAEILAKPLSTQEVSRILQWASRHKVSVTPRGAGTNLTVIAIGAAMLGYSPGGRDQPDWLHRTPLRRACAGSFRHEPHPGTG